MILGGSTKGHILKAFAIALWNFYVIKCFLIDTNPLKYCQNSEFVKFRKDLFAYFGPYSLC